MGIYLQIIVLKKKYDLINHNSPATIHISPYISSDSIIKLNKDRAFAEWDGSKYKCLYYGEDNEDSFYQNLMN